VRGRRCKRRSGCFHLNLDKVAVRVDLHQILHVLRRRLQAFIAVELCVSDENDGLDLAGLVDDCELLLL